MRQSLMNFLRSKLELAGTECSRLVDLFDGLLSMQRFGGFEVSTSTFKSTSISKLVDDVIEAVSDDLIKHGINIECNAPSQSVSVDADRLEECLAKLCRLLMKISKPRSEWQIDITLASNVVIVSVQLGES